MPLNHYIGIQHNTLLCFLLVRMSAIAAILRGVELDFFKSLRQNFDQIVACQ